MTKEQVSRLFKQLMIGVFVYDVLLFSYTLYSGRVLNEFYGGEILIGVSFFVIVIGMLAMFVSLVYAIAQKVYPMLWKTLGFFVASFILYILTLIITLATVF